MFFVIFQFVSRSGLSIWVHSSLWIWQVQYVALRNINLIVQKRPDLLKHEMKVFFVKYNDPIYVKLEKLDIMIRLASEANIVQVLSELKEWVLYGLKLTINFMHFWSVCWISFCALCWNFIWRM